MNDSVRDSTLHSKGCDQYDGYNRIYRSGGDCGHCLRFGAGQAADATSAVSDNAVTGHVSGDQARARSGSDVGW